MAVCRPSPLRRSREREEFESTETQFLFGLSGGKVKAPVL